MCTSYNLLPSNAHLSRNVVHTLYTFLRSNEQQYISKRLIYLVIFDQNYTITKYQMMMGFDLLFSILLVYCIVRLYLVCTKSQWQKRQRSSYLSVCHVVDIQKLVKPKYYHHHQMSKQKLSCQHFQVNEAVVSKDRIANMSNTWKY